MNTKTKSHAIKKILVPTDFSEMSDYVLDRAVEMALQMDASLDIVHVREPLAYALTRGWGPAPEQHDLLVNWIERELASRAERVNKAKIPCLSTSLEGNPHVAIVEYAARSNKDLIIMGTHGRSGLSHAVIGSIAERVVQKSPCPVLVVPRPAEASKRGRV